MPRRNDANTPRLDLDPILSTWWDLAVARTTTTKPLSHHSRTCRGKLPRAERGSALLGIYHIPIYLDISMPIGVRLLIQNLHDAEEKEEIMRF